MMEIEYEATYANINKDNVRERLRKAGAKLVRGEFLQKRSVFDLPKGHEISGGWMRVRDEGDKITLSLKVIDGDKIKDQKEILINVDNFSKAEQLLESLGCEKKAFQESKREIWNLDSVEIMIDEWPHLEPYLEVEGKSEEDVKKVSEILGFDYSKALFCSVDVLYSMKYGFPRERINNDTPEIKFDGNNPFI